MQDEIKVSEGYQPTHQFISFVEGSSSEAPDPSSYPLQVLEADHNLNHLDGGDPTDGFAPWVSDILVYPSSEYWETQLSGDRVRPYFDLSISSYNTLRVPSAIHNYDLYVDNATIYENLTIHGSTTLGGSVSVTGTISPSEFQISSQKFTVNSDGDVRANEISGIAKTKAPIENITTSFQPTVMQSGTIFQCSPSGASITITLPPVSDPGVIYTFMLEEAGKTVTFANLTRSRGTVLSEQYSAATAYWGGNAWYAFGDLV